MEKSEQIMKIFDLKKFNTESYDNRDKNVFFQNKLFKTRTINLKAGESIPECQIDCFVIFYVIKGEVLLRKNGQEAALKEEQVFITEPALLSMKSASGALLMGIQIKPNGPEV
jgi:quercetin dioxygenase-like cupin family protein